MKVKSKKKRILVAGILVAMMAVIACGAYSLCKSNTQSEIFCGEHSASPSEDEYEEESLYQASGDDLTENLTKEVEMTDSQMASYNEEVETDLPAGTDTSGEEESKSDRKLITSWNLTIETEEYDQTLKDIRKDLEEKGGYIESEDENCYEGNRCNCLTLRLPEEAAEEWASGIDNFGRVLSREKSSQDVTLTYVDVESRLTSLRTEEESLRRMMEEAEEIDDIISIQERLSDVNYEIESYESQLRVMKNQVTYSTIRLIVDEVEHEQMTEKGLAGEIKDRFMSSLKFLAGTLRCLTVNLLGYSVLIAVVAGLVFIFMKIRKSRKNRKGTAGPDAEMCAGPDKKEIPLRDIKTEMKPKAEAETETQPIVTEKKDDSRA